MGERFEAHQGDGRPGDRQGAAGFLASGAEMGERMRAFSWHGTPLGDPAAWPSALKTLVQLLLTSTQPMFLAWGPQRTWLYNDAFMPILGRKHPTALGQPALAVWQEARGSLEPLFDRVFAGESVHMKGFSVGPDRRGRIEDAVFDFSYTPVSDVDGAVAGLFGVCVETTERVLADRRAADSLARQRRQFQQAPGFIIVMTGPEHTVEFVNDTHRRVFGSDDWAGKTIRDAFPSLEGQGFFELLDHVYGSGETYQANEVEVRFRRTPDGAEEVRWLSFIYAPTYDDDGRVAGIFCDGFDTTENRRTRLSMQVGAMRQALLAELADRFRDLDDPTDISFAAAELLGRSFRVSRAGYGTIDPAAETIVIDRDYNAPGIASIAGVLHFRDYGSYIQDLKSGVTVVIPDAELDPRTAPTAAALKSISAQSFVNMPVTEQGGFVALLFLNHEQARDWSDEELDLIREVAERTRAVVQRRRAEEALRVLAASLERQVAERTQERDRVWSNSRDLLVVVDSDGFFRAVNPAWTTILGHQRQEVIGHSFLEFAWPDDAAKTQDALGTASSGSNLTDFENRYAHKDGTPRWISWHTSVEGDLVYAYGRDVTAHKAAQLELANAQDALRQSQKMEAVGQLTGGLAHDFNNLLAGIGGNLELLERRIAQGRVSGVERYVAAAQGASRRAAALTQRLLAFSRRQTLDPRPTDVNRLIGGMEDLVRRSVGPDVTVEVVGAAGLWVTRIDPSQLENALLNLCINGRDAMAPHGGRLTIETANKWLDDRAARERDLAPGQYISVCVTDTGTGMSPEVIARAFDPFFTTKPLGEGTGLGLSMVYGFVRQSGGQVRIYSEISKGTTMCLYLPRHTGTADSVDDDESETIDPGAGETVLVIDDEPTIRNLITEVLEELGYAVIEAIDGVSGLRVLQSETRIDLLITDVGLPGGMNGRQVADAARTRRPGLKVLFITGYAENAAVGNGHLSQGMAVMTKPFVMSELGNKVRDLIDG